VFVLFVVLFGPLREACKGAWGATPEGDRAERGAEAAIYAVFLGIVVCASVGRLATVLMDISVDKDW